MTSSQGTLSEAQGQALVQLARKTLMERFGRKLAEDEEKRLADALGAPVLLALCGIFVTLKTGGELRGCIGSLSASEPLVDGVVSHALNAAFNDPRFGPLRDEELERVSIEISVLTEPQPLAYTDADDLVARLRPHVDGVTLRKGYACATFLPQVWEQLEAPEAFLRHLCLKAGLNGDAWRNTRLEVETYQVQSFEEKER
ncbi:MAG: AmmeMemoRadiSam system protein A [Desulfosarcinaceae bacterium]